MSEPRLLSRTTSLLRRFRSDSRGNIAVIFGMALIPVMAAVGSAVDYSLATRMQAKLQSAADAAAVAAISQNSRGWNAAMTMTGDGRISVAENDATAVFNGNTSAYSSQLLKVSSTPTVTKTGIKLASSVQFSADVQVVFMKVMGYSKLTVSGSSSASASLPPFLDFYLMLDVSGSMGLPSTDAEQTRLAAVNPDNFGQYPTGCTLACHFDTHDTCGDGNQKYSTNNYCLGYPISRTSQSAYKQLLQNNNGKLPSYRISNLPQSLYGFSPQFPKDPNLPQASSCDTDGTDGCIQLRADAVGYALKQLFKTANNLEKVPNQFRIGLYPFIQKLYEYSKLTSSINGSEGTPGTINYAAANLASLLDTNTNSNLGSGGTHIDTAFTNLNTLITSVGDGSTSGNTQPYVFLITDGAQDPQTKGINGGGWSGSNHATVIPTPAGTPSPCKPLKDRGIIISVLYIPYQPIQNPNHNFAGDEDGFANANIPNIEPSLQACATSLKYYAKASTPQDINTALTNLFSTVVTTARITN
jgi:Flp pilus assembly protein TadG